MRWVLLALVLGIGAAHAQAPQVVAPPDVVSVPGTTTARTLAARFADVVNVLDFGADPTGAAASDAAFTAAMEAIAPGTWGRVFVPRGSYKLAGAVNQPAGRSIAVVFDDGANIAGPGYLGVDRVESAQGAYSLRVNSGGWFGFAPTIGSSANAAFEADYLFNTPQNSQSMRVGWDRRYTNNLIYGKPHTGIDIAEQRIFSWPNLYDNSSGWGLWEVLYSPTIDEDTAARAGLSASAELSEIDVVNTLHEDGWTWHPGIGNPVQGMSIDPWGQNGNYGGNILFAYGSVGSFDGSQNGLSQRWFSYPAVFSSGNPAAATGTLIVNGTAVNVTSGESVANIATAINSAAIPNVSAAANTWGGVATRLVIYSTQANDQGTLTLSGTSLSSLGLTAGTYTTARASYAVAIGGAGSVSNGDKLVVNGTTVTVTGTTTADVASAINAASIPGVSADTNANGNIVIMVFMSQQAGGLTLADYSGYTTLSKLSLTAGTYLPPTPPKAFATAYSDRTSPIVATSDQITLSATGPSGSAYGPITITLNGGGGTGWAADVAASIRNALQVAGFYSSDFTALSTGASIVAVRSVGASTTQGIQIRNTAGGTLTLADATGHPLEQLGIAAGTYQPGGFSAGSQTVFMAAEDAIAPGGRGFFIGGASSPTDKTVWPHGVGEARGSFMTGVDLQNATLNDNNALTLNAAHAIAWGPADGTQHRLYLNNGALTFDSVAVPGLSVFGADQVLANATGGNAIPTAVSISALLDNAAGSNKGELLYRGASGWTVLQPGATGTVLQSNGSGNDLIWGTSPISLPVYTVATLPTCAPGLAHTVAAVSDATSPTYNGALTGGGAVEVPVFCNGTAWTAH